MAYSNENACVMKKQNMEHVLYGMPLVMQLLQYNFNLQLLYTIILLLLFNNSGNVNVIVLNYANKSWMNELIIIIKCS